MLVFKPRRSNGWLWLFATGLLTIGIGVVSSLPLIVLPENKVATVIVLSTTLLMLILGAPFMVLAAWFPTMRYELDAHTLTMRYGPILTYHIPLNEIQTIRKRNLSISLWSSMRFPGIALFTVPYTDEGNVKMCATAAATGILLIETARDKYGLTPADDEGFIAALQARMGE